MAKLSKSKDALEDRIANFAYFYVNICGFNKTYAYNMLRQQEGQDYDLSQDRSSAYGFYNRHKEKIQAYVAEYQRENREKNAQMRDKNMAILNSIAENPNCGNKDRISAVKELNSMCGLNEQNMNINAKADIELVIE